jgi:SWI/SNF-related matrix-associated actin-dependent regulator of chromatin subfamily A3
LIIHSTISYQRQGVDFLLQREAAVPVPAFSLWEDVRNGVFDERGTRYDTIFVIRNYFFDRVGDSLYRYQHKITGKRTDEPLGEAFGGILADDMGLGKTLMILSTILATLTKSRRFYQSCGAAGTFKKRPSGATLVIVPSAC